MNCSGISRIAVLVGLLIAAAVVVACSIVNTALAKPRVSVKTKYYSITGTTLGELRAQILPSAEKFVKTM